MNQLFQEPIPATLDTPDFRAAWAEWLDHRRADLRRPMTPRAQRMALRRLTEWGATASIAAIEHSISSGYRGIFPAPTTNPQPTTNNPQPKKPLSTWEIKERLRATQNTLDELVYPGGCATAATLTPDQQAEATRLRHLVRHYKTLLTQSQ